MSEIKREILFRGKRLDNGENHEWVYGGYAEWGRVQHVIITKGFYGHNNSYEVDPETIGQYTGFKDNGLHSGSERGNKIFEGDILFYINAEERHYGVVKFGEYTNNHGNIDIGFYVHWPTAMYRKDIGFWANNNCCWVAGNIYDNPELLEVKHDEK